MSTQIGIAMSDLAEVINHQLEQLLDDTSMLAIKMPMKLQKESYTNLRRILLPTRFIVESNKFSPGYPILYLA